VTAVGEGARAAILHDVLSDVVTVYHTPFVDVYINGVDEINVIVRDSSMSFVARSGKNVDRDRVDLSALFPEKVVQEGNSTAIELADRRGVDLSGATGGRRQTPPKREAAGERQQKHPPATTQQAPPHQQRRDPPQAAARTSGTQLELVTGGKTDDGDKTMPIPKREPTQSMYLRADTVESIKKKLHYHSPAELGLPFQVPRSLIAPTSVGVPPSLQDFVARIVDSLDSDFSRLVRLGTSYAGQCRRDRRLPMYVTLYAVCVPEREAERWFAEQRDQANNAFGRNVIRPEDTSSSGGSAPSERELFDRTIRGILEEGDGPEVHNRSVESSADPSGDPKTGSTNSHTSRYITATAHDYRCGLLEYSPSPDFCGYVVLLGCPRLCAIPELGKPIYELLESTNVVCTDKA